MFVGLGNPGAKYKNTRHNVGFMVLDGLLQDKEIQSFAEKDEFKFEKKFNAETCLFNREGEKILLVKPQTFMNKSGDAVRKIVDFYKIDVGDILIIADDIDLPQGKIRLRLHGSSGGHNGLQSVLSALGTEDIARLRVGVCEPFSVTENMDKPENKIDAESYVLSNFSPREKKVIDKMVENAAEIIVETVKTGIITAHTY